ncbi:hypothetical protein HHK36_013895 [Tetracentron sinense]|uniref:Uncharacterized protein n=1 Tax=Tetracentron sinense TaxID=13715 RepID=A0A834ZBA5_TETSI|nr:hypothetical protein HHK36_013895 [Tetracentron sinense]
MAKLSTIVSFALIMILLVGSHYCSASRPSPIKGIGTTKVHAPAIGNGCGERKTKSDNSRWPPNLWGREQDAPRKTPQPPKSPGSPKP